MRFVFIILSVTLISCSKANYKLVDNFELLASHAYDNYLNKQDSIYKIDENGIMSMYMRWYMNRYFKQPENIDELYHAFDRANLETKKVSYGLQYKLMERYKDDIKVFAGDSVTALFYKRIVPENVISVTGYTEAEHSYSSYFNVGYSCFDKDGYVLNQDLTDSLRMESHNGIAMKYGKYKDDWKPSSIDSFYREFIYIEYTPKVFRDARTKEAIPTDGWPYFEELKQWMEATCEKYGFSRMIIPWLVPKDF